MHEKEDYGFDGSVINEPRYNVMRVPLQQQDDDIWQGKVAMTGGGTCSWTLSAVTLGIEYTDATHLGQDLVPGTAVGVTIAFDNDASRNGQFELVSGSDLIMTPQYYPLIHKNKMIELNELLNIFGEEDFMQKKSRI